MTQLEDNVKNLLGIKEIKDEDSIQKLLLGHLEQKKND